MRASKPATERKFLAGCLALIAAGRGSDAWTGGEGKLADSG